MSAHSCTLSAEMLIRDLMHSVFEYIIVWMPHEIESSFSFLSIRINYCILAFDIRDCFANQITGVVRIVLTVRFSFVHRMCADHEFLKIDSMIWMPWITNGKIKNSHISPFVRLSNFRMLRMWSNWFCFFFLFAWFHSEAEHPRSNAFDE